MRGWNKEGVKKRGMILFDGVYICAQPSSTYQNFKTSF